MAKYILLILVLLLTVSVGGVQAQQGSNTGQGNPIPPAQSQSPCKIPVLDRQPKRACLQRRLSLLQQHLQRHGIGPFRRHRRLQPQMLHAVQGLPPDQRLRLAHPGMLLRVALGSR